MDLTAVVIIEQEDEDPMISWLYPSLDDQQRTVILAKMGVKATFLFSRFGNMWHYLLKNEKFAIALVSETYNPELAEALLARLVSAYNERSHPPDVLKVFLGFVTSGTAEGLNVKDFPARSAILGGADLKDVLKLFGGEAVLLWNAMILKKRILVVHTNVAELLYACRCLVQLVFHRQTASTLLRPLVCATEQELTELTEAGVFVAGTLADAPFLGRKDLFDVIVDLPRRKIVMLEGSFAPTPPHRDIAQIITAGDSSQAIIRGITIKVKELAGNLRKLASSADAKLSMKDLESKQFPPTVVSFLFAFAQAEGFALE